MNIQSQSWYMSFFLIYSEPTIGLAHFCCYSMLNIYICLYQPASQPHGSRTSQHDAITLNQTRTSTIGPCQAALPLVLMGPVFGPHTVPKIIWISHCPNCNLILCLKNRACRERSGCNIQYICPFIVHYRYIYCCISSIRDRLRFLRRFRLLFVNSAVYSCLGKLTAC